MAATKVLNWIVYVLKCPRTRAVRYVGWTARGIKARLASHIKEAVTRQRTHKNNWVMSLVSIGLVPEIEVIEAGSGDGWTEAEKRWIAAYRAVGARLVNATDGGEGLPGWGTPEQRSERVRKGRADMTPEQRSEVARRGHLAKTTEQRSAAARKWQADRTPEERSAIVRKLQASRTPEQRSETMRKWQSAKTAEQRSEVARKRQAALTPEERSAATRKANATRTPEERSEIARKRNAAMTPEQRSEKVRNWHATWAARRIMTCELGPNKTQSVNVVARRPDGFDGRMD